MRYMGLALFMIFICSLAVAQDAPPAPNEQRAEKEAAAEAMAKEIATLESAIKQAEAAGQPEKAAMLTNKLMEANARLKALREEIAKDAAQAGDEPKEQPKEEPKEKPKEEPEKPAGEIEWLHTIKEGAKRAKENGMKILVLFTSPTGCPPCNMLKAETFKDEDVISLLRTFVLIKINAWDRGPGGAEAQKWGVRGIPTIVLLDAEEKELGRMVGYKPPEDFIATLTGIRDADLEIDEGKKKIEADASDPAGHLQVAKGFLAKGKTDDAKKNFEKAIELDPKNEKGAAAEAIEKLAGICVDSRDYAKAVEYAKKLDELDPENKKGLAIKAAEMLSAYYGAQRNIEKAVEYADKVIKLDPENKAGKGLKTALGLGQYYVGQGDAENAKKYFDLVKKMDPEDKEGNADSKRPLRT